MGGHGVVMWGCGGMGVCGGHGGHGCVCGGGAGVGL